MTMPSEVPVVIGTTRKIDDNRRVTFPQAILDEVGLVKGDIVTVFAFRGEIRMGKREEA
jgi:bifunctional DNA-binding transcriptional regulator/antitoxin component of YhaV-PrlF toxin-antitoxin module